jgi:hypothetical protein
LSDFCGLKRSNNRKKSKSLDLLRRTRATDLYQSGVELALVSRILGNASIETTKVYATPSMEMLRQGLNLLKHQINLLKSHYGKNVAKKNWQNCLDCYKVKSSEFDLKIQSLSGLHQILRIF